MRFDKVISLGLACGAAYQIRRRFDQTETYPFDWLVTQMNGLLQLLDGDFKGFLCKDNMVEHETYVEDTAFCIKFFHDFPENKCNDASMEEVREKYQRRITRWRGTIKQVSSVLFVRSMAFNLADEVMDWEQCERLGAHLDNLRSGMNWRLLVSNPSSSGIAPRSSKHIALRRLDFPMTPFVWSGDDQAWSDLFDSVLRDFDTS
ncbi:DUF1796 family putative cysteine peptidase [uncultured Rhodoblastus sp.]|uniref:DUF1796 family putative cysteine peptidase n=1 Tax=uncultured Rhodoblastus sp. TaxID=543037 RepID=UPI0025EA225D|nr:DUF1796 family putative cysteine peptidase [uncultured Rhodoblastus sp.]